MTRVEPLADGVLILHGELEIALPLELAREFVSCAQTQDQLRRAIRKVESTWPTVVIAAQPVGATSTAD